MFQLNEDTVTLDVTNKLKKNEVQEVFDYLQENIDAVKYFKIKLSLKKGCLLRLVRANTVLSADQIQRQVDLIKLNRSINYGY